MFYETNCIEVSKQEVERLMKDSRPCSYERLVSKIREQIPELYHSLALNFPNPYADQCQQTRTHYILVHSMIEYFIRK